MTSRKKGVLSITNASLRYQQHLIFESLSLEIPLRSITCILGPSGVGKSSLLNIIAQLPVENSKATATVLNNGCKIVSSDIAYLNQAEPLCPWLNVTDNLLLGARLRGDRLPPYREKIASLLEACQLFAIEDKKPHQLSGGMQQRVALARILLENKPIVLLDEPFSAVDAITRLQLQELLITCCQDKTVIMVTHDPLEALRIAKTIFVLSGSPAAIEAPLPLNSPTPRSIDDPILVQQQVKLYQQLTQGHRL